ncbi:MAG: DUF58 domain-containing protein [Phycisphaerae bacterium]
MPEPAAIQPAADGPLLDADFMARLEQLELVSRKIFAGKMKGERRSPRKGESVEFADYRNYVVGDDLRFLDWNLYARLDQLFLRLFIEEEDLSVTLLLDVSTSMDFGSPHKGLYAKRVAAAIAYIGLVNLDRVSVFAYSDRIVGQLAGLRSKRLMARVVSFLNELETGGASDFAAAAREFAIRHTQKGVCLVVSDFLDKRGLEDGLRHLLARRLDVYLLHLLSPQEVQPELTGDLKLVDAEDDDMTEVTISRPLLDRYRANLEAYCTQVREFAVRRGMNYLFATTQVPFDQVVMNTFRQRGLVR